MSLTRGQIVDHHGYQGIVLEVVNAIPDDAPCERWRGQPGALIYWRQMMEVGEPYPEVLQDAPSLKLDRMPIMASMQYIPLSELS